MISNQDLRDLAKPNFKIPIGLLTWDWAVILGAILIAKTLNNSFAYFISILLIAGRQHALFVLVHEGVHKHLARGRATNDFIATYLAAYPVLFDMHAYRVTHLKHHEHLNTDQDPDWVRKKDKREWKFPARAQNMILFSLYFVFFRGPVEWALIVAAFSGVLNRETYKIPQARMRLFKKAAFYSAIGLGVTALGAWPTILAYWLVPLFFVFPLLQRMRSISEHFGLAWTHELNTSRDILTGRFENSLLSPHGVNYHLSHHLYPGVPCYRLDELQALLMKNPEYAHKAHVNYGFFGKRGVLKDLILNSELAPGTEKAA